MIGERDAHPGCLCPTLPGPFSLGTVSLCHVLPTVILRPQLLDPPRPLAEGMEANWVLTMFWT